MNPVHDLEYPRLFDERSALLPNLATMASGFQRSPENFQANVVSFNEIYAVLRFSREASKQVTGLRIFLGHHPELDSENCVGV